MTEAYEIMKLKLLTFLLLIGSVWQGLSAQTFKVGGLWYEVSNEELKRCQVTGYDEYEVPSNLIIPSSVSYDDVEYQVSSIGFEAFAFCNKLESVSLPDGIGMIYMGVFRDCVNLKSVDLPNTIQDIEFEAFAKCKNLEKVVLPEELKNIWDFAFSDCTNLGSVTFSSCLKHIGAQAFSGCPISDIAFPESLTHIMDGAFSSNKALTEITIPLGVEFIGTSAFGCDNLKTIFFNAEKCAEAPYAFSPVSEIVFGDNVKWIPSSAFYGSDELTAITIPESVTQIGGEAFLRCSNLESVFFNAKNCEEMGMCFPNSISQLVIGENVETISSYAFNGLASLTSINIPESVTSIGQGAFEGCDGVKSIYYNAIECQGFNSYYNVFPKTVEEVIFGDKVRVIPDYAFSGCQNLTELTIPESVTKIGYGAFNYCDNIKTVYFNSIDYNPSSEDGMGYYTSIFPTSIQKVFLGDKVRTIPEHAFLNCKNLTSIEIPESLEKIGFEAFSGCRIKNVMVSNIEKWLKIDFNGPESNPLAFGNLILNGELVRKLVIPEGVRLISGFALMAYNQLLTVTFPSTVEYVGNYAFWGCQALQKITFPDTNSLLQINYENENSFLTQGNEAKVYIGDEEFIMPKELSWPSSLTKIPDYAFYGSSIERIEIPETVTELGKVAFGNCEYLSDVNLPSEIKSIPYRCFNGCRSLQNIMFPDGVTEIGQSAFAYSCLNEIRIPLTVRSIKDYAFEGASIGKVRIPSLEDWAKIEFGNQDSNPIYNSGSFYIDEDSTPVAHLNLNMGDETVSSFAFYGARNIKTANVKAVSIGRGAFSYCENMESLCLDVEEISDSFQSTPNLNAIYCLTTTPPTAKDDSFEKYALVKLYVPEGTIDAYENAEYCWWKFLEIEESSFTDLKEIFDPDILTGIKQAKQSEEPENIKETAVFSLEGLRIASSIEGLPKGMYIVRTGSQSRVVCVK